MGTEVVEDAPLKSGRVMWSESVLRIANKVFPWSTVS